MIAALLNALNKREQFRAESIRTAFHGLTFHDGRLPSHPMR